MTEAAFASADRDELLPHLAAVLRQELVGDAAGILLPSPEGDSFRSAAVDPGSLLKGVPPLELARDEGVVERAVRTRSPVMFRAELLPARDPARVFRDRGSSHGLILPLAARGRSVAVAYVLRERGPAFDEETAPALVVAARRMGAAVDGALQLRSERLIRITEEERRRRADLLALASGLMDESLNYRSGLGRLAASLVPQLGDWCAIYLLSEDAELEQVAAAHRNPDALRPIHSLRAGVGGRSGVPAPVLEAIRAGRVSFESHADADRLATPMASPYQRGALERLGCNSLIAVPMQVRQRSIGALLLVHSASARLHSGEDLELARDIARRAAVAVDKSRLCEGALRASQAKSDFLAVMSHELRTPLNAILGYTDLLAMGLPAELPAGALHQVDRIKVSGKHLLHLINEILTFARIEAGRESIRPEPVDVTNILREVVADVEPFATTKHLELIARLPEGPLWANTDAAKVRQIAFNLLNNAVKFTSVGRVDIALEASEDHFTILISDTGIGIAPEHQNDIFEAFWQVEQVATRKAGGTGLGLSVVWRLVRMMGGEVEVDSDEGRGSTFVVRLPRQAQATLPGW